MASPSAEPAVVSPWHRTAGRDAESDAGTEFVLLHRLAAAARPAGAQAGTPLPLPSVASSSKPPKRATAHGTLAVRGSRGPAGLAASARHADDERLLRKTSVSAAAAAELAHGRGPSPLFGRPLQELAPRPGEVPVFVERALAALQTRGAQVSGREMFADMRQSEIAGMARAMAAAELDHGRDLATLEPRLVAEALQKFLLALPDPVLTFDLYDAWLLLHELRDAPQPQLLHAQCLLLLQLPGAHRALLARLLDFLAGLAQPDPTLRRPIATSFAPLLLRPPNAASEVEALSTKLRLRIDVVEDLLAAAAAAAAELAQPERVLPLQMEPAEEAGPGQPGSLVLRGAPLDTLLDLALGEFWVQEPLLPALLCLHAYYTTPADLLARLLTRFREHRSRNKRAAKRPAWRMRAMRRVLQALGMWLGDFRPDVTLAWQGEEGEGEGEAAREAWTRQLREFVEWARRKETASFAAELEPLAQWLQPQTVERRRQFAKTSSYVAAPFPGLKTKLVVASAEQLQSQFALEALDEAELAEQMTLIDHDLFKTIPLNEFLGKAFTKPERSPAYARMVEKFNAWGLWAAAEVLARPGVAERAALLAKLLRVTRRLLRLRNYNGAFAILAGLNFTCVRRLRASWDAVPRKWQQQLQDLEALFQPMRNHKAYREALQELAPGTPCVPYMALYGRMMFAFDENLDSWLAPLTPGGPRLVNVAKLRLVWKVMSEILYFQSQPYANLRPNLALRAYLHEAGARAPSEDALMERSRALESASPVQQQAASATSPRDRDLRPTV